MDAILELLASPAAWAALLTLVVMEVVLGIDNLIFISILSNKLPEEQRQKARRLGISLALIMRAVRTLLLRNVFSRWQEQRLAQKLRRLP